MAFAQNDVVETDDMSPEFIAANLDRIVDMRDAHVVELGSAEKAVTE
jgi:hypothetical protein